jgi:hypothetical protein
MVFAMKEKEGWIFVTRGAYRATASDPYSSEQWSQILGCLAIQRF